MKNRISKEEYKAKREALKFKRINDHNHLMKVGDPTYLKKRNTMANEETISSEEQAEVQNDATI